MEGWLPPRPRPFAAAVFPSTLQTRLGGHTLDSLFPLFFGDGLDNLYPHMLS